MQPAFLFGVTIRSMLLMTTLESIIESRTVLNISKGPYHEDT